MPSIDSGNGQAKKMNLVARSEEVQELLSRPPGWLIRWGVMVVLILILIFFVLTWVIRYPEVLEARVKLTSINQPSSIIAPNSGRIQYLLVKEGQLVDEGEALGVFENSAVFNDVLLVKKEMVELTKIMQDNIIADRPPFKKNMALAFKRHVRLGELQNHFANTIRAYRDYELFKRGNYYERKISAIQKQMDSYLKLNRNLADQAKLRERDMRLTKKIYTADTTLVEDVTILNFLKTERELLHKENVIQQNNHFELTSNIQLQQLQVDLVDIKVERQNQEIQLLNIFQQNIEQLLNQLKIWEQKYVIVSPAKGLVSLNKRRFESQYIKAGEVVMAILPLDNHLNCEGYLPVIGAGKVQVGQKVLVTLNNYPHHEFGFVKGIIQNISSMPMDSVYTVNIRLPQELKTNMGRKLTLHHGMSGKAEIITEDLRLIERFFNQLRKAKINIGRSK